VTHTPTTEDDERRSAEGSRWLPDEAGAQPERARGSPSRAARQWAVHSAWNPPRQAEATPTTGVETMPAVRGELQALATSVQRLQAKVDALQAKVEGLERAITLGRDADRVRAASARDAAADPEPTPDDAAAGAAPPRRAGTEADHGNINSLSFEGLRELGLSVNQAARLISERDRRGGFGSLDELDALHGFPQQLLDALKRGVRI
jgi:DNA uptake protein ComE-like DNA-binding protein